MLAIPAYFSWNARKGISAVVTTRHGQISAHKITLKRARQLWEDGCGLLRITPAGAHELYGEASAAERLSLIAHCSTPEEVEAILGLKKPSKELQRLASERLQEISATATAVGS